MENFQDMEFFQNMEIFQDTEGMVLKLVEIHVEIQDTIFTRIWTFPGYRSYPGHQNYPGHGS